LYFVFVEYLFLIASSENSFFFIAINVYAFKLFVLKIVKDGHIVYARVHPFIN